MTHFLQQGHIYFYKAKPPNKDTSFEFMGDYYIQITTVFTYFSFSFILFFLNTGFLRQSQSEAQASLEHIL